MGKKFTTNEFIIKANLIHKSKYTYNKTIYIKYRDKVIITCPIHGDFKQTPAGHLVGKGCSKCGKSHKMTLDNFKEVASKKTQQLL